MTAEYRQRNKAANYMTAILLGSGGFYLGYYLGCLNPLFEPIFVGVFGYSFERDTVKLNYYNGILNMLFSVGALVGVLTSGMLADRFGRRYILYGGELLAIICCVPYSYADVYSLMTARALSGVVSGINSSIFTVMLAELLPNSVCGFGSGLAYLMITAGTLLAYLTQNIFSRSFLVENWRYFLTWPVIVSLFRLILFPIFIKTDTAKYIFLSQRNQVKAEHMIIQAFRQIYISNDAFLAASDSIQHFQNEERNGQVNMISLFSVQYRKRILSGLTVALSMQMSGINFFMFYSTKLFEVIHEGYGKPMTLAIGITNFIGSIIAIYMISQLGRKFNLVVGLMFQAVGMYFILIGYIIGSFWCLTVGCCVYMIAFATGFGGTETAYLGEILPPAGVGMTLGFQWIITSCVGQFLAELIDSLGPISLLVFFSVSCTVLVFVVDYMTIETKGKSEQAVVKEFETGKYKFMGIFSTKKSSNDTVNKSPLIDKENKA